MRQVELTVPLPMQGRRQLYPPLTLTGRGRLDNLDNTPMAGTGRTPQSA